MYKIWQCVKESKVKQREKKTVEIKLDNQSVLNVKIFKKEKKNE